MVQYHRSISVLVGLLFLSFVPGTVRGQLPDAEAAEAVLQSIEGIVGDLSVVRALPVDQRVRWIREEASNRVKAKVWEAGQEQLKSAMDSYAQAAFRAKAFEQLAVPAFKHAAATGGAVDWSLIESRISSEVDTKVQVYGAALAGAGIAWDSLQAFQSEGAQAGFLKLAAGVYDAVAGAYIPGWGWFKLGVSGVEALGNHVLQYATDTAVEGMLEDMFGRSSDPAAFARMLRTVPLAELYAQVEDRWELVAFGRVWKGQGTDGGDEAMKERLKDAIFDLKALVAAEEARQRKEEEILRGRFQPLLDAAAAAEAALARQAEALLAVVDGPLSAIRLLDEKRAELQAEEALEQVVVQDVIVAPRQEDVLSYQRMDRTGILALYEAAYSMVPETLGSAYDPVAFDGAYAAAVDYWRAQESGQTEPPDGPGKTRWLAQRSADRLATMKAIDAMRLESEARGMRYGERLRGFVEEQKRILREAKAVFDAERARISAAAAEGLYLPATLAHGSHDVTEAWLASVPFHSETMGYWMDQAAYYVLIQGLQWKMEVDRNEIGPLQDALKKAYADYRAAILAVDLEFKAKLPPLLQKFEAVAIPADRPDRWRYQWELKQGAFPMGSQAIGLLPVVAEMDHESLYQEWFEPARALARMETKLSQLFEYYERARQQALLNQVVNLVKEHLDPFRVYRASDHGLSMMARVGGIRNYRATVEETDLARWFERMDAEWAIAKPRVDFLGGYQDLIAAEDLASVQVFGQDHSTYASILDMDRQERATAPGRAEGVLDSLRVSVAGIKGIFSWMNPEYYDEKRHTLEVTLRTVTQYMTRARAGDSAVYVLIEEELGGIRDELMDTGKELDRLYRQALAGYGWSAPDWSEAPQELRIVAGETVSLILQRPSAEEGGTFSSASLPHGLVLDTDTGLLHGMVSSAVDAAVMVRFTNTAGFSAMVMFSLVVEPAPVPRLELVLENGRMRFRAAGLSQGKYLFQEHLLEGGTGLWRTIREQTANGGEMMLTDEVWPGEAVRFFRFVRVP